MNIHFTNKEIFNLLYNNSLVKVEFGSKLYNLSDSNSDTDIMCIYADTEFEKSSLFTNHHQFQYKENNVDYIFTSLSQFIKNSLSGDSTISFEIINSGELKDTCLKFLDKNKNFFFNYETIRSYLGFGKRDLEKWEKEKGDREQNKKIIHGVRSYQFAEMIASNSLNMDCSHLAIFKEITSRKERIDLSQHYQKLISKLRTEVNEDIGSYQRKVTMNQQKMLDEFVSSFNPTFEFPDNLKSEIYKSNEFGIEY